MPVIQPGVLKKQAPSVSVLLCGLVLRAGKATIPINPAFNPTTFAYNVSFPNTTAVVTVTPTAQDSSAVIRVNEQTVISGMTSQPIYLNVGENTININVTPAGGGNPVNTYVVTVTRAAA